MSDEKRSRKSFEEAKAARINALEKKLEEAKARVTKLEADLEAEKARTRKVRPMREETKTKKLGELLASSAASKEKLVELAKAAGIEIPEELL